MRAVVFDFYGTLAEFTDDAVSWSALVAELGYELTPEILDEYWNVDGHEHDEHSQSREHYVGWQQQRMRDMLDACGVPERHHEAFVGRVLTSDRHREIAAYDEVVSVLADLRNGGVQLAVCSNWDWDLREAMRYAGLDGTVDVVVSSAWVGARKPHPRIYAHMLRTLDVPPDDVLFVGDTWSCDVAGPRALGMEPVYVRRPHFGPDTTAPLGPDADRGVHRATSLRGIPDLL